MLVLDDRVVDLSVGPNLRGLGVRARLLAAGPSHRIEIRVAERGWPGRVDDPELQLVDRQGRAEGRGRRSARDRDERQKHSPALHPLKRMTPADPFRYRIGTNLGIRTYKALRWKAEPIIPSMPGVTGQVRRGRRVG